MAKDVKMVSAEGTLLWAKVNTVFDEFKGQRKYKIRMELPEKDEKELISVIQKAYKEYQGLPENEGKEWRHKSRLSYKPDKKTGKIQFSFQTNAFSKSKDSKEERQKVIPVYTKYGQVISDKSIGNGSKGKIYFELHPYHESEDSNGITLRLLQILVTDLVEFGSSAAAFEFETFVPSEDDDDEPFVD